MLLHINWPVHLKSLRNSWFLQKPCVLRRGGCKLPTEMKNTHAHMGTRLRELRTTRGLQQGEVARRLGVSPAYLSLIEKDKRAVQLPLLFKALELYGVGMEEFMQSLGERRVDDGLARLLDEPLLRSLNLSEDDLAQL